MRDTLPDSRPHRTDTGVRACCIAELLSSKRRTRSEPSRDDGAGL